MESGTSSENQKLTAATVQDYWDVFDEYDIDLSHLSTLISNDSRHRDLFSAEYPYIQRGKNIQNCRKRLCQQLGCSTAEGLMTQTWGIDSSEQKNKDLMDHFSLKYE